MHSFAAPARQLAACRRKAVGLADAGLTKTGVSDAGLVEASAKGVAGSEAGVKDAAASRRGVFVRASAGSIAACALAFAVTAAHAQDNGGAIMIAGPAETNPAAVVAMAKNAGMTVPGAPMDANANSTQPLAAAPQVSQQPQRTASQGGYARAAHAADAAMRAAALALDARADAADASSSSADTGGMIVIPGPGEAKAAAPKLAMSPSASAPAANGMIEIPGNGEPKATPATNTSNSATNPRSTAATDVLPRVAVQAAASARDVMPIVVQADGASNSNQDARARIAMRAYQARPIAAAPAMPIAGGMMNVSMHASAPIRAPLPPALAATGSANPQTTQDGDSIRAAALVFLTQQAAGLPGKADITVTPVFPRGLAPCTTLEPFMPAGARLWGRTTVGVRCSGDRPWTLYLQARVSLQATYYLAARAIAPGEVLTAADLIPRDGDLTAMPQAIVTDPSQAVGAVTLSRIVAGLPLRTDMLRGAGSIAIGQSVRVVTDGAGFSISAEGSAMNNAVPGQQVRVKTAGGQIISGIAKDGSTVEVRL